MDAARTGIATGAGAVIGATAGGKGAAIGAGAGAAAAVIPTETLIESKAGGAGDDCDQEPSRPPTR